MIFWGGYSQLLMKIATLDPGFTQNIQQKNWKKIIDMSFCSDKLFISLWFFYVSIAPRLPEVSVCVSGGV